MTLGVWLRRIAVTAVVAVVAIALLTARVVRLGEAEMRQSQVAFDRGDVAEALERARRAAVLYVPGAPHVGAAYERMRAVARGSEATGDSVTALRAWRAIRGAALETRHVRIARLADLEMANAEIARLEAMTRAPSGAAPAVEAARATALAGLVRDDAPRSGWVVLLAIGLLLTVSGFGWVAWRGVLPDGRLALRAAAWGLVLVALGVACWTLAVVRA